jgi:hypothetical protein
MKYNIGMKKTKKTKKIEKSHFDDLVHKSRKRFRCNTLQGCLHIIDNMTKKDYEELKAEAKRMFPDDDDFRFDI